MGRYFSGNRDRRSTVWIHGDRGRRCRNCQVPVRALSAALSDLFYSGNISRQKSPLIRKQLRDQAQAGPRAVQPVCHAGAGDPPVPFNHAPLRLCASTQHENQSQNRQAKNAQSKMPAATSRFSSRRVDLVAFSLLLQKRTVNASSIRRGPVLSQLNRWRTHVKRGVTIHFDFVAVVERSRTRPIQLFKSAMDMKLTICCSGSFARSTAAKPSSINSSCHA